MLASVGISYKGMLIIIYVIRNCEQVVCGIQVESYNYKSNSFT